MSRNRARRKANQTAITQTKPNTPIPSRNNHENSVLLHREQHAEIHRSGPLPSPDDLALYNQIIPNGADRIMKMAENQAEHRQQLEKLALQSNTERSRTGQYLGFILNLVALLGFIYLTTTQSVIEGLIGTLSTLILGIIYYIVVYHARRKELEKASVNKIPE